MNKANFQGKIINDPVYGFITINDEILLQLIDHPYFQRLRHISQMGLAQLVYPGARHTRFHHALGVFHLMQEAVKTLRDKGVEISEDERLGLCIAGLLHDIGHGPFSHALEHSLFPVQHEQISLLLMQKLRAELGPVMDVAISIFNRTYPKPFLCNLVSGQLDLDRTDYLLRDSFYTGVVEGTVGAERIIKLLHVHNNQLVVEEKGIYSLENFLLARRLMYWQVYIHKTVISSEHLITSVLKRAKQLVRSGKTLFGTPELLYFLSTEIDTQDEQQMEIALEHFLRLEDNDIISAMKQWARCDDKILSYLAQSLWHRKLFKIEMREEEFTESEIQLRKEKVASLFTGQAEEIDFLFAQGMVKNTLYQYSQPILVRMKSGEIKHLEEVSTLFASLGEDVMVQKRHFLLYPKKNIG
ncbi:MAG TPA: HD domain-containing protein [Bacteroidia bacterium]